jgi:hypothetical protein
MLTYRRAETEGRLAARGLELDNFRRQQDIFLSSEKRKSPAQRGIGFLLEVKIILTNTKKPCARAFHLTVSFVSVTSNTSKRKTNIGIPMISPQMPKKCSEKINTIKV